VETRRGPSQIWRSTWANCNHRRYAPHFVELVRTGAIDPTAVLTKGRAACDAIKAYEAFDQRRTGWVKVELKPAA
jgi:threonine dehydrogenase-like Zn-dependent dehydrogenase